MTSEATDSRVRLAQMQQTCQTIARGGGGQSPVLVLAVLAFQRALAVPESGSAAEALANFSTAVKRMRSEAESLPDGNPDKEVRAMVAEIGQALIDGDMSVGLS